jgi:hypothetical protein
MARSHIYAAEAAAITQNVHLPLLRQRYAGTIFLRLLPLLLLLLLPLPRTALKDGLQRIRPSGRHRFHTTARACVCL